MPSSADILARLFGSASRVKLIRIFLLNQEEIFPFKEIVRRAKVAKKAGHKEISLLNKIGFIRPKSAFIEIKGRKGRTKKKKISGWKLDPSFPLIYPLKNFVLNTAPIARDQIIKKLQRAGRIKLIILSGIFGEGDNSRVDIFVVGDGIRKGILEKIIRDIEAEVGKELTYAFLKTEEFLYRLGMYDKFIRDILDYPHEKILDKIGL